MIFGAMAAPDFFSHKSDREKMIDLGEVNEDSDMEDNDELFDNDDDYESELSQDEDTDLFPVHRTPFSSKIYNQFTPVSCIRSIVLTRLLDWAKTGGKFTRICI